METPYPCRIARPLPRSEFQARRDLFVDLQNRIDELKIHYQADEIAVAYLTYAREEVARAYGVAERDRRLIREWCLKQGFD